LTETLAACGNYGLWDPTTYDWNPTNDQPQLPSPCLDEDFNPDTTEDNPCKGKHIQITFTGPRVMDNNHGWKEIHPIRRESYDGQTYCVNENQTDTTCPSTGATTNETTTGDTTTGGTTTSGEGGGETTTP
jgi:hypothetical protein